MKKVLILFGNMSKTDEYRKKTVRTADQNHKSGGRRADGPLNLEGRQKVILTKVSNYPQAWKG